MDRRCLAAVLVLAALLLVALPPARATVEIAVLTTVAGSAGTSGATDGAGPAGLFARPLGLAVSPDGVFAIVADTDNNLLRRVDLATSTVTTLAGAPKLAGATDGPGAEARFAAPSSVSMPISATFALVADTQNSTVRRIDLATSVVTTVVGLAGQRGSEDGQGSAARLYEPEGLAVSRDGSFALIADTGNHTIRRLDLATGALTTLAGQPRVSGTADGVGALAQFSFPRGVAISPDGSYALVADSNSQTIRRIDLATATVTTFAGGPGQAGGEDGAPQAARFFFPRGLVISADGSYALVANFTGSTIRRVALPDGTVTTLAGANRQTGANDGASLGARLYFPGAVGLTSNGTAIIADTYNHTIRRLDARTLGQSVFLPIARK
ncbi:MAG: hypothetical protein OHK0022_15590 [Roseiflexaceae bacterium]